MISRNRMKIDLLAQSILIMALLLLALFATGFQWTRLAAVVLAAWQILSALHLYIAYRYVQKQHYLTTVGIVLLSLPLWVNSIGWLAWGPVIGLIGWYFFQTIRDTLIVFRRPRSFWDL